MKVENAVIPPMEQALEFFGAPEDGPFVMVNLLKFKDRAEYAYASAAHHPGPDAAISKLYWSEYHREVTELAVDILGDHQQRPAFLDDDRYVDAPFAQRPHHVDSVAYTRIDHQHACLFIIHVSASYSISYWSITSDH